MLSNQMKSKKGSILLWAMGIVTIISVILSMMPQLFKTAQKSAIETELQLEARVLASNLKELAKYLIFYERYFYVKENSLVGTAPNSLVLDADIRDLWSKGNSEEFKKACGGFGPFGAYLGEHKLNHKPLFCPMSLRNPYKPSDVIEQLDYNKLATAGAKVLKKVSAGRYQLTFDFTKSVSPAANAITHINYGQRIFKNIKLNSDPSPLRVEVTFLTNSSGFQSVSSERYIEFKSIVQFETGQAKHFVEDKETVILAPLTAKDFSLFFIMPSYVAANASSNLEQRPLFANLSASATTNASIYVDNPLKKTMEVYGRVFHHGYLNLTGASMDDAINNLPNFNDVVILGDTVKLVVGANKLVPGPKYIAALRNKFKKGMVSNYSPARFIQAGMCDRFTGGITFSNDSQVTCREENTLPPTPKCMRSIDSYVRGTNQFCGMSTIRVEQVGGMGKITLTPNAFTDKLICTNEDPFPPAAAFSNCGNQPGGPMDGTPNPKPVVLQKGYRKVTVDASLAMVMAPVGRFEINRADTVILGTVLGGSLYINQRSPKFYSISAAHTGVLQGTYIAPNEAEMTAITQKSLQSFEGISFPLLNLPAVYTTQGGVR